MGNDDTPTVLVAAAVLVERGRVLLTQRKAGTHLAGAWELPGGKVRAGEDPRDALRRERHTLKRTLTDPHLFSGIGNAYSDEILHAARLSPIQLTHKLADEQWQRLFAATRDTLQLWIDRLNAEASRNFPEKVTAFRNDMSVHGRFGQPCPTCGQPIQRIRYADNETNYCAQCQTGGKVLADRSLSRLLGADWPRTLDELEALKKR